MDELVIRRWRRGDKDRLYVNRGGAAGPSVAWRDLRTGETHILDPAHRLAAEELFAQWTAPSETTARQPRVRREGSSSPPALPTLTATTDLETNLPGKAVREKIQEIDQQHAPFARWLLRALGVSEAGSWRKGLRGEQVAGAALGRLEGRGWHVLHSIRWPSGADTDHLVIGPPGVFVVNTKRHKGAHVWVGDHQVRVNNQATNYLRNSVSEGKRVASVLGYWCGWEVPVTPVLAFVGARKITLRNRESLPILVLDGSKAHRHLGRLPAKIEPPQKVSDVFEVARRQEIWLSDRRGARDGR